MPFGGASFATTRMEMRMPASTCGGAPWAWAFLTDLSALLSSGGLTQGEVLGDVSEWGREEGREGREASRPSSAKLPLIQIKGNLVRDRG